MNLDFPLSQEKEGGTQEFLMRIRASKLKNDELLDELYDKVIENYDYHENYYIVLIHAVYDIPGKIPRIPGNEINAFSDFMMDNFEGNTTFNFAESLVESLQEVREQKKDSPEMVTVSCDEMEQIFGYCGVPDEKLSDFKENWEMYFSNEPVALDNIHNSKTVKIVTPDATICIQPDKIALIELKEINGVPSLVIPVNGELKINGMEVELK